MSFDAARVKSLFLGASDLAGRDERAAYLNRECGGDRGLRERVEGLLQAHDASPCPDPDHTDPRDLVDPRPAINTEIAGKYKLMEEIGEGGMGHVYMAQQSEPIRRVVAVKVIKPGMDSRAVLARFEAERQALAIMDHPNIARVLDAGVTDSSRPFFVMELIKGVPITEFCDARKLTLRQRLELFVPVCQAIQHAHQKGIIHRDIKPSNVLVALYDDLPTPKVIDFGVAKAVGQPLTECTLLTGFGAVVGTPEYMSPEQASFNQVEIDARSDVYALGVLLYELLTGSPPVSRKVLEQVGMLEMLRAIRETEPATPSTKLSTADGLPTLAANRGTEPAKLTKLVRGDLDWIVMKALEKNRNRRYETANSFAQDLKRYLADQPVQARPPSLVYRLRKFARRNRVVVLLSTCLALLAATIAGGGWLYGEATRDADRKRREFDHAQRITEAHEKIPLIQAAVQRGQYTRAFDLLTEVEPLIPDHPNLSELWERCSQSCSLTTVPAGVDIWLRPYDQPSLPWRHVVHSAVHPVIVRIPRGEYLWRATKTGYREVIGLRPPQEVSFTMDKDEAIPKEMVRVSAGSPNRPEMAGAVAFRQVDLPAFLIDRHEVTNSEYDQFVKAGGYDQPKYWQELAYIGADGAATTWENVKPLLVDRTGRAGPATWRNGAFPPGEEDFPVRGVSWYEAVAYSRFADKSLPTIYHWAQASQVGLSVELAGDSFITRSNFGPRVQSTRTLADYGIHGMVGSIGNVKEWCINETIDGQKFILGGGCGEPIYMPLTLESSHPLRREEFFGFRCMKSDGPQAAPAAASEKVERLPWRAPPRLDELLDAATFRLVVADRFIYDRNAPLNATSEQVDEGDWIHVTAQVNAAYKDAKGRWERLPLHLFLPKNVDRHEGYQTITYFPGGDAAMLPRMRPLPDEYGLDALVRSGRAVLWPVYQGMYERRYASSDTDARGEEDRFIGLAQDLFRAVDYLQQRGDINMDQLGYHGFSWGASSAGSLVALEPRFRAVVFEAGGLSNEPLNKERALLEWRHYLPRIQVPILMLNGEIDPVYPVRESQQPMFRLLGSTTKEHHVHPRGHHMLPPEIKFPKISAWFDQHLGTPARMAAKH